MKKIVILIAAMLLFSLASMLVNAIPVQFTIAANGIETIIVPREIINQSCTFNNETNTTECTNQTITINETETKQWSSKQDVEVDCELSCSYQMLTFSIPPSVKIKNYTLNYDKKNNYVIVFKSTNKTFTQDHDDKINIKIRQPKPESIIQIEKIFPKNLTLGTNQINLLIRNLYDVTIYSVDADISGQGIKTTSTIQIQNILPGDRDYIFVTINATEPGTKEVIVKITAEVQSQKLSASYINQFSVAGEKPEEIVNISALVEELSGLKEKFKEYEVEYIDKKSQGYLVTEVYDAIKSVRENIQNAQLAISENRSKDAQKYIFFVKAGLDDVKTGLQNARKAEKTFADKIKENALLISTISAALVAIGSLISLAIRQMSKVRMLKERLKIEKIKQERLKRKIKK